MEHYDVHFIVAGEETYETVEASSAWEAVEMVEVRYPSQHVLISAVFNSRGEMIMDEEGYVS